MVFLIIIGIALYFTIPLVSVFKIIEYFDVDIDGLVGVIGWGTVFILAALLIQILTWIN